MTATATEGSAELLNLDINLERTARPESESNALVWEGDTLKWLGIRDMDCSAFKVLTPETQCSLQDHLISFAKQRKYAMPTFLGIVKALTQSLAQHPTSKLDLSWLVNAITITSFVSHICGLRSFFIYWQDRYPQAVTSDALQFLTRPLPRKKRPKNILSDDPEKSWLTDPEYDAVLRCCWNNYDQGITETQVTLMRLLALQYARRPNQFTSLKFGDFRDGPVGGGNAGERRIHFPGAKDRGAAENFRDGKEEVHPIAEHLWNLIQIRKHEVKALFEKKLDSILTEQELEQLPVFTSEIQLEKAIEVFTDHYRINWQANLSHRIFHLPPQTASMILSWTRNKVGDDSDKEPRPRTPLSHRTGKPIKITATRMRHTRARQLARLGTPKHVLSFWLGHESEATLESYYNDPAEEARQLNEAMKGALVPLAMAFTGKLLDDESQASRVNDPESTLEFAADGNLKNVGKCGKHSFCATTSVPIPCYRCKEFEPLVHAPHQEVLHALLKRQAEEKAMIKIGGSRRLLTPIDLGPDIRAVQECIARCNARKAVLEANRD